MLSVHIRMDNIYISNKNNKLFSLILILIDIIIIYIHIRILTRYQKFY